MSGYYIDPRLSSSSNAVIAAFAAGAARSFASPFSVSKICSEVGVAGNKSGPIQGFRWIKRIHGVRGFYRGNLTAVARLMPYTAIQFYVFDKVSSMQFGTFGLHGVPTINTLTGTFIAGSIGGVCATVVTHPLDVVKTRLTVSPVDASKAHYRGAGDAFAKILAKEGIVHGLYRGFLPSIVGSAIYSGSLFAFWDIGQNIPWLRRGAPFLSIEYLVDPMICMTIAFCAAQPWDVFRKKLMAQSFVLPKEGMVDFKFSGFPDVAIQAVKKNGLWGLFDGMMSNILKVAPYVVVFWLTKEVLRRAAPRSEIEYEKRRRVR